MAPAPRKVSVAEIKSKLLQPALTSHYQVYIQPPDEANRFIRQSVFRDNMQDLLMISCCESTLPGSQLATFELNNDFTGVSQKHAYRKLYDDRSDFTFYVNQTYDQIRYFEAWIRFISGEQVSGAESTTNHYRVQYPKKYKSSTINITKFERNQGTKGTSNSIVYTFINCFPISIVSMPISYDSSQLLKVTVSFSYERYVTGNLSANVSAGIANTTTFESTVSVPVSSPLPVSPFQINPNQQALINQSYSQNFNLSLSQFNLNPSSLGNYSQNYQNYQNSNASFPTDYSLSQ